MKFLARTVLVGLLLYTKLVWGQPGEEELLLDAQAPAVEDFDSGLWPRDKLTGDWGGHREQLAESGLTINASTTYVFQGVAAGGFEGPLFPFFSDENSSGNTLGNDVQLELGTAKAGGWEGGVIRTRLQSRNGRSVLERAGTVAAVNNEAVFPIVIDRIEGDAIAITELTYEHDLSEQVSLFGGLLNTSMGDENAISGSAQSHSHFLNFAMLYSLVEDATVPHASLGGGINYSPLDNLAGSFSVFGSAETAGENPFNLWHGTTFSTEWTLNHTLAEREGAQTLGFLYGINARRTDIAADPRLVLISLLLGLSLPTTQSDTWAVYYNASQYLQGDAEGGWGLFTRLGLSDGNPNFVQWNFAGGLGGVGLLPGRTDDSWGLGLFYLDMSDEDLLRGLGIESELGSEVYYNIALSPAFHVTLDAQLIDSGLPTVDSSVLLSLRSHFEY